MRGRVIPRLRVQVVCARFPFGAGEEFIEAEVRSLEALGISVELNPTRRWGRRRVGTEDLTVVPRGVAAMVKGVVSAALRHPKTVLDILVEMLTDRGHLLKNLAVLPAGLQAGSQAPLRAVDHIHAHWLSTSSTVAWVASRVSGAPFSVTAHRWDIVDGNLLITKARDATFVRAISARGREQLVAHGAAEPLPVIHMGVDVPELVVSPNRQAGQPLRLVCPANLIAVKGHQHLLHAIALCGGRAFLDLAGQGPERPTLEKLTEDLALADRVRFLGQVRHDALLSAYADGRYDAVVLPSLDLGGGEHEGIPVSLMEGMAAGLPVISTRTGAIEELVEDGATGFLVRPGNARELASAINMLAGQPQLCRRMGQSARQRVKSDFSATSSATMLLSEITRTETAGDAG